MFHNEHMYRLIANRSNVLQIKNGNFTRLFVMKNMEYLNKVCLGKIQVNPNLLFFKGAFVSRSYLSTATQSITEPSFWRLPLPH